MREGGRDGHPEDQVHAVGTHVARRLKVHRRHGPQCVCEGDADPEDGTDDRDEKEGGLREPEPDQAERDPRDGREDLQSEDVRLDPLPEGGESHHEEREQGAQHKRNEEAHREAAKRGDDCPDEPGTVPEVDEGASDLGGTREQEPPDPGSEDQLPDRDGGNRDRDHRDEVPELPSKAPLAAALHSCILGWLLDHWTSAFRISFERRIASATPASFRVRGLLAPFSRIALTVPGRWDRTTIRSPRTAASRTSCVTNRVVVPLRSHRSWTTDCISSRVWTSRAANGSSMSRTRGRKTRARARATRCFIPPDSSCTRAWGKFSSWTIRIYSSTRASRSPRRTPATRNPNEMFPQTSSHGKTAPSWKTTIRSAPGPWTRCPSISTQPVVGSSRPATILSRVDL